MFIYFIILIVICCKYNFISKISPNDLNNYDNFGTSIDIDNNFIVVGSPNHDQFVTDGGSVYIYEYSVGSWDLRRKIISSDVNISDSFGHSVAIFEDTVVVGVPLDNDLNKNQGSAYIFEKDIGGNNLWGERIKLMPNDGEEFDYFGYSVSVNMDNVIIGSPGNNYPYCNRINILHNNSGAAYIFNRNNGGSNLWGQVRKITPIVNNGDMYFGNSVDISNNFAVVGAPYSNSVYVFEKDLGELNAWGQITKIIPPNMGSNLFFGLNVKIENDIIIVSQNGYNNNRGAVDVFKKSIQCNSNDWLFIEKIEAYDYENDDNFGTSISINNGIIVIGAPKNDYKQSNTGSIYIYNIEDETINFIQKIYAYDNYLNDHFGDSVATFNNTIIVGSWDDDNGINSGSIYIYENISVEPPIIDSTSISGESITTTSSSTSSSISSSISSSMSSSMSNSMSSTSNNGNEIPTNQGDNTSSSNKLKLLF